MDLAALRDALAGDVAPDRLLDRFSDLVQPDVPHDRLTLAYLEDDGHSFTVVAERAVHGPLLHRDRYTSDGGPTARHAVGDWRTAGVFAGTPLLVEDVRSDPRFADLDVDERAVWDAGFRSTVVVPVRSAGRIVGTLAATSLTPGAYGATHVQVLEAVGAAIGPHVEHAVVLQRERRRRRRLGAAATLAVALGASLDVRDVFGRLAETVRPVLDFDVMGVALISSSGRDVEITAEVHYEPTVETPARIPLEHFSFAPQVLKGETVLIADAATELSRRHDGDRLIIDGGGRSVLSVPLRFGERVAGCVYFGKRRPRWYDDSDVEVAMVIAAQVVVAVQHQRLAEEQRRLVRAEGRARRLQARVESLRTELGERYGFESLIGRSPALRDALTAAAKVAPTDTTVLITGESGTGKELIARAIHQASLRAEGPFVAINCAALPETLLESELFGHERGAFTGADRQKPGRFELADGGTLFLDEVAELSPAVQAKLLRVLQEKTFERVGGTATVRADVRLVAATNRDLKAAVARGEFRSDLYYRLDVFTVALPPLRERGDDVLLLADHFVRTLGAHMAKGEPGLARDARDALLSYPWPGNIRELQNAIERALIVADGGLITAAHLALPATAARPTTPATADRPFAESLPEWERRVVRDALATARGNKSRAARALGLTRSQLYTKLRKLGLE